MVAHGSGTPKSTMKVVPAMTAPKDYTTTAPSTSECLNIDTRGFRWATFTVHVGNVAGTSVAVKVQQSSDNFVSDAAADVTGATFTTIGTSGDNTLQMVTVDCSNTERYLKLAFTFSSITAAELDGLCILTGAIDSTDIGTGGVDARNVATVV